MPQSLAKIQIHLVYSTKNRERVIEDGIRTELHAYMGGILKHMSCYPIELNTELDHAHILFVLGRTITIADVVANLKRGSTNWLRTKDEALRNFHWQSGYGAFSVSESNVSTVRAYIRNQKQHHRNYSFMDEFRALLRQHNIDYDERYVWD